jgi:DNA-binding NarL/FixJ family response regulator
MRSRAGTSEGRSVTAVGRALSPPVVMLVIEQEALRALTALTLEFAGFRVVAMPAGAGMARPDPPACDVAVADLIDGNADDWEWLRRLTGRPAPRTRLVFVADPGSAVPAVLKARCAAVVLRPVDPATLVKIVAEVAARDARDD